MSVAVAAVAADVRPPKNINSCPVSFGSVPFQKAELWPTWLCGQAEGSGQKPIDTGQRQTWLPQLLAYRCEPVSLLPRLSHSYFVFLSSFFFFFFCLSRAKSACCFLCRHNRIGFSFSPWLVLRWAEDAANLLLLLYIYLPTETPLIGCSCSSGSESCLFGQGDRQRAGDWY